MLGMHSSYFVRQYLPNLGLDFGCLERQCRKRSALSLNVFAVRPSIGQALSNDTHSQFIGAPVIVHAKGGAVVVAEIKLRQITVQMFFGAMLVGAEHAALEN